MMELLQGTQIVDIPLLALLLITAFAVARSRNLLVSTVLLGVFSLLMAAEYLVLGAPDVAITEAAVGAGIGTVLFLLALSYNDVYEKKVQGRAFVPFVITLIVTAMLLVVAIDMPEFGSSNTPASLHLSPYFIEFSEAEIGIPNIVTSILASYRGYDTLGEVTVVFTAALAAFLLLKRDPEEEDV